MTGRLGELTCAEVEELAGLYVLDGLTEHEREGVRAHLATCDRAHPELALLGSVVPALATMVEQRPAPPGLRDRVLAAVAAEAQATPHRASGVRRIRIPAPRPGPPRYIDFAQPRFRAWVQWGTALAAVAVIALLGTWTMVLQSRANQAEQRTELIARAIAVLGDPTSDVAVLRGTGVAAGASGFAVFPAEGSGYVVLVGLPEAPVGRTYQAWFLVDGTAASAGLLNVADDGYAVLEGIQRPAGTDAVALTLEVAGGVAQPTGTPIVSGEVEA